MTLPAGHVVARGCNVKEYILTLAASRLQVTDCRVAQTVSSDSLALMPEPASPKTQPKRVSLFATCLVDQFYPEVAESVVNVLERLGVEVDVPKKQTCCGQPAYNSGYWPDARAVATRFLDVFDGEGPIVVPSGSCGAMVRHHYAALFRDDPVQLERSRKLGNRLFEFSEFVVDVLGRSDAMGRNNGAITYHQCCHLLRDLGIDRQPRALLEGVDGPELRPLERADVCCGFGGTFAVKMADISSAMLDEKLDNVEATGAETLVAGDAGCIMHMAGGLRRRGSAIRVAHLAQFVDESMSNADAHSNAGS